jgi:hypothetical protein
MNKNEIEDEDVEGHSDLLRGDEPVSPPLESTLNATDDVEGHQFMRGEEGGSAIEPTKDSVLSATTDESEDDVEGHSGSFV